MHTEVQLSHLFPYRSPFWAQRSSFSCKEKGFHVQSLGSLKLIVFVFPVSVTACRGLASSCVIQNVYVKTSVFRWVSSTSAGALCRISSSVAGLIPGERTSATPRSVLQISDRHLRRYPIRSNRPDLCEVYSILLLLRLLLELVFACSLSAFMQLFFIAHSFIMPIYWWIWYMVAGG